MGELAAALPSDPGYLAILCPALLEVISKLIH